MVWRWQPCVREAAALYIRAAALCIRACVTPASLNICFHSSGS